MNDILIIILIPLLSLFLTVLDTSFFSFYEIFNATVISTFVALLTISIFGHRHLTLYFAATTVLFMTAFSSLPLSILVLVYFGIPLFIFYIRSRLSFEPNLGPAVAIFVSANVIFRLLLITSGSQLTNELLESIIVFPIINSLFAIILFVLVKRFIWSKKILD